MKLNSCFLDASKAFDKVHYGKLFNLMLKRSVPSVIVRIILDGYTIVVYTQA